ncbi:hypothetical protein [Leptospira sp. GIMC2001]|uniref:hypothetical protein n=1 Tax=Leptospira sp. GIMC2001 TaxID=1513297 RepID=UPI00234BADB9|nr:hypothetical protein [Leptospira sp. GIMC2001]WCL48584.1 hypothetical protein O4O04_14915 [Leptospira sp. GIMC2001]
MSRSTSLSILVVAIVLLGNAIIVLSNLNKMEIYPSSPPFRMVDHTKSYQISQESSISNLLDNDSETHWNKLKESPSTIDWEIELSLTHYWNGSEFVPKNWKFIDITSCSDTDLELTILYREAINVDKVLRLPEDFIQKKINIQLLKNQNSRVELDGIKKLERTMNYPDGIYILTILGKHKEDSACLSLVDLEF